MRLFLKLSKISFQRQITYRAATLAGLATNFFFGLLRVAVLVALYGVQNEVAGLTITDAITFTALSQATIAFLSMFHWYEVMNAVYTGDIATDLLKPLNYFTHWLGRDWGRAIANLLMRGVTILLIYALVFDITVPQSAAQWLAVALTLVLSWLVSFSWRFLVNLTAFWTPNALGIIRFAFILSWFMSGFLMPLRFFPDWFITLCYLTPFPYTVNAIIEVYLGVVSGPDLLYLMLGQTIWIVILILAGQVALRAGIRHLVIQGG
jgi:ABC-2 type transport system permease protein